MPTYDSGASSDAVDRQYWVSGGYSAGGPDESSSHEQESSSQTEEAPSEAEESSSEAGGDLGGLLDIEASEADSESESDDAEESDEQSLLDGTAPVSFWDGIDFPQFSLLPPELRALIWECYLDSVLQGPRVLEFQVTFADSNYWTPITTPGLDAQMLPVMRATRVNHESRAIVRKKFPDQLLYGGEMAEYSVPFDAKTDLVAISFVNLWRDCRHEFLHPDRDQPMYKIDFAIPGFTDRIKKLVISADDIIGTTALASTDWTGPWAVLGSFPNLEVIYEMHSSSGGFRKLDYSLPLRTYDMGITELDEAGFPHHYHRYLAWPDLDCPGMEDSMEVKDTSDLLLDFEAMNGDMWDLVPECSRGIKILPMVEFAGAFGLERMVEAGLADFDHPSARPSSWGDSVSDSDEDRSGDSGHDDDEYDSEMDDFIDDSPVVDFEGTSDLLDSEAVAADGDDDLDDLDDNPDNAGLSHGPADDFVGFSPVDLTGDSEVGDDDQDDQDLRPAKRRRARQIISEDEDDDLVLPHDHADNFGGFSPIDPSSGSEVGDGDDGKGQSPRPSKRRKARQIISEDDDDDAEDARPAKKVKTRQVVVSDSEDDTSTDSEEDAPRLQRGRPRVPDSESEDEDSDAAIVNSRKRKRAVHTITVSDSEDDAADAAPVNPPKRKKAVPAVVVSDSEDDDSSEEIQDSDTSQEDEDDEEDDSRPLTLAEKLGMHSRANPIDLTSDNEESSVDIAPARRGYGHSYEDEDDEDEDDDEDQDNGNGRCDGYPDSGSEEEDEEEDEY
ncbi:hypothetical protein RB597_005861 [Gaeumannomyces tritici]